MFSKKVFSLFTFSFFLLLCGSPSAQTSSDTLRADLEQITIQAAYSPITIGNAPMAFSYRLRSQDDLASRTAATLDDLTFSIPGINVQNRENYALGERLSIRGLGWRSPFGVRGVQVLLDDLPLTVADGQSIMNMIDPAMVRRIELLRGPSATFWGNSSGGVLYLSTVPNRDDPLLSFRTYGGSYETLKQEIRFNHASEGTHLYGYSTLFNTDGYRDHSAAQLFRGSIGLDQVLDDNTRIKINGNYTTMPKAQHPGALTESMLENSPREARQNFESSRAGKEFQQAMAGASVLREFGSGIMELSLHGTYRDLQNPLPFGFIGLERFAGGARGTFSFSSLPFELDTGFELKIQQDDRLETNIINGERGNDVIVEQTEDVNNRSIFMRSSIPISDRLTLSGGARADWIRYESTDGLGEDLEGNREFFSLNPSAGITYRFGSSQMFANFSTSFETPTTTELVNRPGGGNGFNQNVDPEKAISLEAGIRGSLQSLNGRYDVTVYRMQVEDILLGFQTETGGPVFFRNKGETNHYGIESSIRFNPDPLYSLDLMANVLRAAFNGGEFDGNNLPGVPTFKVGAIATLRPGSQIVSADFRFTDRYAADSANENWTDSFLVTNLRWSTTPLTLGDKLSLKPFVNLTNIFDTRYATSVNINAFGGFFFEPGAARSFNGGFKLTFQ